MAARVVGRVTTTVVAITLGLAVYCCGPKVKPVAYPVCPGGDFEICEQDDIGEHNCFCLEE